MQDAHCMSCRRAWSRDVLSKYFPVAWLNGDYKRHRETILVEREKQLLPESQHLVANYQQTKRLRSDLEAKNNELNALKRRWNTLQNEIYDTRYRIENFVRTGYRGTAAGDREKRQKMEFIAPCPVDTCRGFMNSKMVCGTCEIVACEHCGAVKDSENHECDPDIAANFKVIKKQTKPCPKCAVPTMKSSGCSQMWCTQCHTTWDWNTSEIQRGVIHNPHYFQYMRERSATGEIPRQPGDGPPDCNRQQFPGAWAVNDRIKRDICKVCGVTAWKDIDDPMRDTHEYKTHRDLGDTLCRLLRKLVHIEEVEIRTLRNRHRNAEDNADLRLKYLVNEISEEEFRIQLQRREKKREKDIAVRDVYQMVCDTGRDVIWMYMDGTKNLLDTVGELTALKTYANTHLKAIATQYKMHTAVL
jgi:hypothetical protein